MANAETRTERQGGAREATVNAREPAGRLLIGGLIAGAIAGVVMAMWTMVAGGTYGDFGVFTPMYLIASPFAGADEVRQSLSAAPGDVFWWSTSAALLGVVIHMVNSMMFGVIFAALARWIRLRAIAAVAGGIVFAMALMLFNEFVTLPAVEAIFGGVATAMSSVIGWTTWTIAHVLVGAVLGLWVFARPRDLGYRENVVTLP